jgi:hypothetical protein
MELQKTPPEVALVGLRAIKGVAMADGEFHSLERGLLNAVQRHILGTAFDLDDLEPITPNELAAGLPEALREQFFNGCLITALIDSEASDAERAVLDGYASALGIQGPAIKTFHRLVDEQLLLFRLDVARRSFLGQRLKAFARQRGLRGISSVAQSLLDNPNQAVADRYRRLEEYADGTLGRGYLDFIRANGFALPGEVGGPPEPIVFHDGLHVLAEYGTSALEEAQIASFQAGLMEQQPMFGMFFMLAQFQLGVQITPITGAESMQVDPNLMIEALVRGTRVRRDLTTDWDPWNDFNRPVLELRRVYNIVPREDSAAEGNAG